jgi:hypothetical protein
MCKGDGCTQRDQCFRFRAKPDKHRQSYFMDVPGSGDECHHFMPVDGWPERMLTELDSTELAEPEPKLESLVPLVPLKSLVPLVPLEPLKSLESPRRAGELESGKGETFAELI